MKIVFAILILIFNSNINAQIIDFVGFAAGHFLNRAEDTVTFGFIDGYTIGVDNNFNEEELSNKKIDSLELRIFQRNREHYSCIVDTAGNEIYFENNIQMKKDFRSISSNGSELYFEVENLTNNFENGYIIYLRKYHNFNKRSIYLGFSAISECGEDKIEYFNWLEPVDSAFLLGIIVLQENFTRLDRKNYKYFYFHLKLSEPVSVNEEKKDTKNLLAYPNPAMNTLIIESNHKINIYNLSGYLIYSLDSSEERKLIDLSLIPAGVYIIHTLDKNGMITAKSKFIKG